MHRPHRILVVDDNPITFTVLSALLSEYTWKYVESGQEALEIAPRFRPDIVLLDIMMPGIDGYETCHLMRRDPSLRHTKIIMLSAKSELKERLAGYESGADDYITKPFDGGEVLAKLRVYLRLKSVEEIEEVKNRVIAVLQHSNRTPLNSIISYAELITSEVELDSEMQAEAPQAILRNARRLHRMLEKVETLAIMKSGNFAFDFASTDLCAVVRRVLAELTSKMDDTGVTVETQVPPSAEVICDVEQIEFAVHGIIENAICFSESGGLITVDIAAGDDDLVLSVSDQGIGISEELLPCIFDPFGNPDSPLLNQGDGLSLSIIQQIIWAHDGDLRVESELGRGAEFTMRIPVGGAQFQEPVATVTGRESCETVASTPGIEA